MRSLIILTLHSSNLLWFSKRLFSWSQDIVQPFILLRVEVVPHFDVGACMGYLVKCFRSGWRQFRFKSTPQGIIYRRFEHHDTSSLPDEPYCLLLLNQARATPACQGPHSPPCRGGKANYVSHFFGFQMCTFFGVWTLFSCVHPTQTPRTTMKPR